MNRNYISFIKLLVLVSSSYSFRLYTKPITESCGYESCPKGKPEMLNVHIIAHSHDDLGWLKTVEEYYYGVKNFVQDAGVQYILGTVIKELAEDPTKRFIYCETGFLSKWYDQQSESHKELFKKLLNNGQMEIVGGGWSQNDEATTHYSSIIDQMTLGLTYLENNFGKCGLPRVGWQIDPFGHSKEMISLFSQMGFDAAFSSRWDYEDLKVRKENVEMEFIWKGSNNLGQSSELLHVILPNYYWWPNGFCFDQRCPETSPVVDDPESTKYNVKKLVHKLLNITLIYSQWYKTNNVLLPMGGDFAFQNAHHSFLSLDKLIKYINKLQKDGSKINAFYSTPNCYIKALYDANLTYSTKYDDVFPLGETANMYWTGYYTSRPAAKYQERYSNNILQICKQLSAMTNYFFNSEENKSNDRNVQMLSEALGIMQHHDAITGTAKQLVANDYSRMLAKGVQQCEISIRAAYETLMRTKKGKDFPQIEFCHFLNISQCMISTVSKKFAIILYNALAHDIKTVLHLPVVPGEFMIKDTSGSLVENQVLPIAGRIWSLPKRKSFSSAELVFPVKLPPLGYTIYYVEKSKDEGSVSNKTFVSIPSENDVIIKNDFIKLTISKKTGLLKYFENLQEKIAVPFKQEFFMYKSDSISERVSGAYLFKPLDNIVYPFGQRFNISIIKGSLVEEVHQKFNSWISQVIRLRKGQNFAEFDWIIGPIPTKDEIGKEIITRYDTNLDSKGVFYTDANGREAVKRVRNRRHSWKTNVSEPITSNYYPITSRIYLQDTKVQMQLTVLTDRSQGGSSISDGSIELMLHRRLSMDDDLGVEEVLNEPGEDGKGLIVRGKHWVTLSSIYPAAAITRNLAHQLYMSPLIGFINDSISDKDFASNYVTQFSLLESGLPPNIHLLSLEKLNDHNDLLIRLEHFFEWNEDAQLSQPVTISLKNMFKNFIVVKATEVTLGANQLLNEVNRLRFRHSNVKMDLQNDLDEDKISNNEDISITLTPMQIRTFFIKVVQHPPSRLSY